MSIEYQSPGESPMNRRLYTFPSDARLVLRLRNEARIYRDQHHLTGPVADLEAEQSLIDSSEDFRTRHNAVNQPITFLLPDPILKTLSMFAPHHLQR